MTAGSKPQMRNTRWSLDSVNLEGQLPPFLLERQGVVPFRCTIDPRVPEECALALLERQLTKKDYASMGGLRLEIRSVCSETSRGAIGVLMFGFVAPGSHEPVLIYPIHFDSDNLARATWLDELAGQSHLHLLIIGRGKKLLDVLQFENTYDLARTHAVMRAALDGRRGDSRAAVDEIYANRTALSLWNDVAEHAEGSIAPQLAERETTPEADYHMLVVGREEIEAGDANRILATLAQLRSRPDRGRAALGTIDMSVHGYDRDPRELYEIPEVRRWFERFIDATPDLFFFVHAASPAARLAMLATIDIKVLEDGRVSFDKAGAREFIGRHVDGMNRTMREAGIDSDGPLARRHFDAVIRHFNG